MQHTSLDKYSYTEGINLTKIIDLAGTTPAKFGEEAVKVREAISKIAGSKEATEFMLTDAITHHYGEGLYAREMFLPKGSIVLSRVHLADSINIISKGKVRIIDTNGDITREAPSTFLSTVGTHRIVFALEDTVWTGVHHSNKKTPEDVMEELTVEDYQTYLRLER
jgi:hypothetical protein